VIKPIFSIFGAPAALMLLAGTALFAGPPPPTVTTLSFVPSASAPQFSAASAVITVTSAGLPVTSGTVKLYQAKTQGVPGSCAAQNGNAEVQPPLSATPDTNGQATFDLYQAGLTNTIGTFGYIAAVTARLVPLVWISPSRWVTAVADTAQRARMRPSALRL
jgi:hypothetical protein